MAVPEQDVKHSRSTFSRGHPSPSARFLSSPSSILRPRTQPGGPFDGVRITPATAPGGGPAARPHGRSTVRPRCRSRDRRRRSRRTEARPVGRGTRPARPRSPAGSRSTRLDPTITGSTTTPRLHPRRRSVAFSACRRRPAPSPTPPTGTPTLTMRPSADLPRPPACGRPRSAPRRSAQGPPAHRDGTPAQFPAGGRARGPTAARAAGGFRILRFWETGSEGTLRQGSSDPPGKAGRPTKSVRDSRQAENW